MVHQKLCLNLCWNKTIRRLKMWLEHQVEERRRCQIQFEKALIWSVVHTRHCLVLNLFVRELSKRHDSCECTICSLLERMAPCSVQWADWSVDWFNSLLDGRHGYPFVFYFFICFLLTMEARGLKRHRSMTSQTAPSSNESEASSSRRKGFCQYTQLPYVCMRVCI